MSNKSQTSTKLKTAHTIDGPGHYFIQNPRTKDWKTLEGWVDFYTIGSEGGSAWLWRDDSNNPVHCIGMSGKTRQEAIKALLELLWRK